MWTIVEEPADWVQLVMMLSCTLLGMTHIVRPRVWVDYFVALHAQGERAVVTRTFSLELWPAILIVTLHPVLDGAAAILTVYGWAQAAKVVVAMLFPALGLRSLRLSAMGPRAFVGGGFMLLGVGAASALALFDIA
jgi:hypothetical protein